MTGTTRFLTVMFASGLAVLMMARPGSAQAPWQIPAHETPAPCERCHDDPGKTSHPTGIVPSMKVPADLPLEGGRVTCTTCHDVTARRATGRALLRRDEAGSAMCRACHRDDGPRQSRASRALKMGRARSHS